ncbi:hypothetical protein BDY19DRAFT_994212 [Irpex rosettiformis]|uniref:Uncharacterized protein n=1 Tax=Irpex rosettiformis TaxID=378272 RepID=A0ACB8U2B0_9APHY|nr:hypothetical protein BDY19DRAFT_994212 [Irpex rosettiformis]
MTAGLRIDEAYLLGGWCAAALWGIFSFLLVIAMVQVVQLHSQGRMNRSKWLTTSAIVLLYCLATTHASLELRRVVIGLIDIEGPGAIPYFADILQPLHTGGDFLYITSIIIADVVVAWRCYVVWHANKYVTAILVALLLGTITAGYGAIAQFVLPVDVINPRESISFGYAMYSMSLATNVVTLILTVGRVWWQSRTLSNAMSERQGQGYRRSTYSTVLLILIESGLFIAVAKVTEFVLYKIAPDDGMNGCNGLYIIFDMIPQINGIVPTLIIILVNAKKTITDAHHVTATNTFRAAPGRAQSSTMVFADNNLGQDRFTMSVQSVFAGYKADGSDDGTMGTLEATGQKAISKDESQV